MINYENKAKALSLGLDKTLREISKAYYADFLLHEHGVVAYSNITKNMAQQIEQQLYQNYDSELIKEAQRLNDSFYHRQLRLKRRIEDMLSAGDCLFLTLTFKDSVFETTNEDTRRQYIRKFLKKFNTRYVANKDYGEKNGREHYHAVIQIDKINAKLWRYGSLNFEKIVNANAKALSKYVAKLKNHAIKETTRNDRIIYSVN